MLEPSFEISDVKEPDVGVSAPTAVQSSAAEIAVAGASPEPNEAPSLRGTFMKVWKAEEFSGLYKGAIPASASLLFVRAFITPSGSFPATMKSHGDINWIIVVLITLYLPFMMFGLRAATTGHNLRIAQWKTNVHLLFTPAELSPPPRSLLGRISSFAPLKYLARLPFTHLLNPLYPTAFVTYILSLTLSLAIQSAMLPMKNMGDVLEHAISGKPRGALELAVMFCLAIVGVLVGTPLDVVTTRMAVQQWHGHQEDLEEARELDKGRIARADGLRLTCDEIKYKNSFDCFIRIVREEGWGTLYRAWGFTFLEVFFLLL